MDIFGRIGAFNFTEEKGYIYLSNFFYNGLFKLEVKTGETVFLGHFKGEKLCGMNIHKEVFRINDHIYFCPMRGRHLHIYDLADQSMRAIEIRKRDEDFFVVRNVILDKRNVFFIPRENRFSIRKLDLDSLKVIKLSRQMKIEGKDLSECEDKFPIERYREKFCIEGRINRVFWGQTSKGWYGFLSNGKYLLQYREGTEEIGTIPFTVMNKTALEQYLPKVIEELSEEPFIPEGRWGVQEFLEYLKAEKNFMHDSFEDNESIGEIILGISYNKTV